MALRDLPAWGSREVRATDTSLEQKVLSVSPGWAERICRIAGLGEEARIEAGLEAGLLALEAESQGSGAVAILVFWTQLCTHTP